MNFVNTELRTSKPDCWTWWDRLASDASAWWQLYDAAHHSLLKPEEHGSLQDRYIRLLYNRFVIESFQRTLDQVHSCPGLKKAS